MTLYGRLHAAARRHPHADIAVGVVVFAVTLLTTTAGPTGRRLDPVAVMFAVVACAVLAVRQRFPVLVLLTSTVAAESYLMHQHGEMVLLAPLIALYTVADAASRRGALIVGVISVFVFAAAHVAVRPDSPLGAENVALAALGGLAVAAGNGSRNRRAYLAEVRRQADHAEADRAAEAARLVTEERLRIARDLHDEVGHHLALIHVQAGVATHVLRTATSDAPPAQAEQALAHIRTASKAALVELRDTVGLLRQPGDRAPVEPVVGLAGVDDLLSSFRRSGLDITLTGQVRPIAAAADLTAYRVIQESLTNVCKHNGPAAVTISLTYPADRLRIVVQNAAAPDRTAPAPAAPPRHGHGLAGMRERVTALGGDLRAGPRHGGGYCVTAELPLSGGPA